MNYYNEWDKNAAEWLRELIRMGEIPDGFVDDRSITEVKPDELNQYPNVIFSPELPAGAKLSASQESAQTDLFGREVLPASHSPSPETKKGKPTFATSFPSGSTSSSSASLQSSLESRLKARLPTGGLTMFIKGWKQKATPAGRLYCQLVASAHPIDETDCSLWQTPDTMDSLPPRSVEAAQRQQENNRKGRAAPGTLREQVCPHLYPAMWPTAQASDVNTDRMSPEATLRRMERKDVSSDLPTSVKMALWPTTDAYPRGGARHPMERKEGGHAVNLQDAALLSIWPTCASRDVKGVSGAGRQERKGDPMDTLPNAVVLGMDSSGTSAPMAARGQLNAQFPAWMMGYKASWCVAAIWR